MALARVVGSSVAGDCPLFVARIACHSGEFYSSSVLLITPEMWDKPML